MRKIIAALILFMALFVLHPRFGWTGEPDDMSYEDDEQTDVSDNAENDAQNSDYTYLEADYGKDLKTVPFVIRYAFERETGVPWQKAEFDEKGSFIQKWQQDRELAEAAEAQRKAEEEEEQTQKDILRRMEKQEVEDRIAERKQLKIQEEELEASRKQAIEAQNENERQKLMQLRSSQRTQ
jgi:hypothetical protein